ncbi:hypothetical protein D3C73_1098690 [compost metagenome]
MIKALGLLLLGVAQPILAYGAFGAQIEGALHRRDGERQTALVGGQEAIGIDADGMIANIRVQIAAALVAIEIEVGVAGEADRGRRVRAGPEVDHQILLLQPVLQGHSKVAGEALISRP